MSDNKILRTAQRLIRARAARMDSVEVAYNQTAPDKRAEGLEMAALIIEDLIDPSEES